MPVSNEPDAPVSSALSVVPTSLVVSSPAALPVPSSEPALPSASSESATGSGPPAFDPLDDIPPLDPMLEPVAYRRAELEKLGERIAELSSRIQAATYDLLVLIREFDAGSGWSGCQWQPKTAHFWQLKTAHFGRGRRGRIRRSPVDVPRAFRAGRRERSDRRPVRNAARSWLTGGHPATPSRRFSVAVRSHSWCSRSR